MLAQPAPAAPPVRSLGSVVAKSTITFSAVNQLVPLSDGRVLVADASERIVTMLDASLAKPTVVFDSTMGKQNTFTSGMGSGGGIDGRGGGVTFVTGGGGGGSSPAAALGPAGPGAPNYLVGYRGDSLLWFDRDAGSFVVIEPSGKLGRVMAAPAQASSGRSLSSSTGMPSASATLGLIYKLRTPSARPPNPALGQPDKVAVIPDSMSVVRMDYATRGLDTLAKISMGSYTKATIGPNGLSSTQSGTNIGLYSFYDDVAVTSDGTIAVFHAHEYRLEWIGANDQRLTGSRLTYPWHRITDDRRQHIVDSINAARKVSFDSMVAKRVADSARTGQGPMMTMTSIGPDGTAVTRKVPEGPPRPAVLVTGEEVPDFLPPTVRAPIIADADNHVWLRPILDQPEPGFAIWDVISRTDGVVDRVRIPDSRTIVGFGVGGFVYLAARDAGQTTLEKVRLR
jgi:hypothetical protein